MRIIGVDPGLNITGYGCIEIDQSNRGAITLIEAGVIRTKQRDPLEMRLKTLFEDIDDIIKDFRPEVFTIEDLYSHYKVPRTAIIMGHARGAVITAAGVHGLEVFSYAATRVKKSLTGNGHASKEQMQRMIMSLLGMNSPPEPADVADALSVALCHANLVSHVI